MGQLNASRVAAANAGFQAEFYSSLLAQPQWWQQIAREIRSEEASVTLTWTTLLAAMRKWVGARHWGNLSAQKVTLTPEPYEISVEVERDAVDDDAIGLYSDTMNMMGIAAGNAFNDAVVDLLINGFTATGYDNVAFFSNSHTEDGGANQDNLSTETFTNDHLDNAMALGAALKAPNGDPLNIRYTHVIHGPSLRATVRDTLKNDRLANGASNPWMGGLTAIESPRITNVRWFLLDLSKGIKPLVFWPRQTPEFISITDPESEPVKERRMYQYGAEARMDGEYLWWQLALGSTAGV